MSDVLGQARRDIEAGEEIVVAFDLLTEIECVNDGQPVDVGPALTDD